MSFYATLSGNVRFSDSDAFTAVLQRLRSGGWVVGSQFVGEDAEPMTDGQHIFEESGEIIIPLAYYRNLTRVEFFTHQGTHGTVRGSSTDGVEICWVEGPPSLYIPEMPLRLFTKEEGHAFPGDAADGSAFDQYQEWIEDAAETFHAATYDSILADAKIHFGVCDLWRPRVDMLAFTQQLETLKQITSEANKRADSTGLIHDIERARHLEHLLVNLALSEIPKPTPGLPGGPSQPT